MGAPDQLREATGDEGLIGRARSNPRLLMAIVGGAILLLAWIGWAIYVASSDGARAGLGVVIAWPALLIAVAIISLPFIGGYLLIRRLSEGGADIATAEPDPAPEAEEDEDDSEGEEEDDADDDAEPEDEGDDEEEQEEEDSEDESGSDSEAEASAKG